MYSQLRNARRQRTSAKANASRARRKQRPAGGSHASIGSHERLESRVLFSAVRMDAGFMTNVLTRGGDVSSGAISLNFSSPIQFYGHTYSSVFINTNGVVTFGNGAAGFPDAPMSSATV